MDRIWFKTYKDDEYCGAGVSMKSYVYKRNAERAATKMYGVSGVIRRDGLIDSTTGDPNMNRT